MKRYLACIMLLITFTSLSLHSFSIPTLWRKHKRTLTYATTGIGCLVGIYALYRHFSKNTPQPSETPGTFEPEKDPRSSESEAQTGQCTHCGLNKAYTCECGALYCENCRPVPDFDEIPYGHCSECGKWNHEYFKKNFLGENS